MGETRQKSGARERHAYDKETNDESNLALGLDSSVGLLDNRDRELEAGLKRRLLVPLLEQRRGPVLRNLVRSCLMDHASA